MNRDNLSTCFFTKIGHVRERPGYLGSLAAKPLRNLWPYPPLDERICRVIRRS